LNYNSQLLPFWQSAILLKRKLKKVLALHPQNKLTKIYYMTLIKLLCHRIHRIHFYILYILVSLIIFSSCAPVYNPNNLFMPGLKERGDLAAEFYLGSSDIGMNAAYAITDNWAITAGAQNRGINQNYSGNSTFFEGGAAWFQNPESFFHYEVMGGFGYGKTDYFRRYQALFTGAWQLQYMEADFMRFYLQYNIHFPVSIFTFSVGARASQLHIFDYEENIFAESDDRLIRQTIDNNFNALFLEPNINISIDIGNVSLFMRTGFSFQSSGPSDIMDHDPFMLNGGFRIRLNTMGSR